MVVSTTTYYFTYFEIVDTEEELTEAIEEHIPHVLPFHLLTITWEYW